MFEGFTDHMDVANAPVTYFSALRPWIRTTEVSVYMALTLVCDGLLVRLATHYHAQLSLIVCGFMIYERKYV